MMLVLGVGLFVVTFYGAMTILTYGIIAAYVLSCAYVYVTTLVRPRYPYLSHGFETSAAIARYAHMPLVITTHLANFSLPLHEDALVAPPPAGSSGYPVVLFAHGLGGESTPPGLGCRGHGLDTPMLSMVGLMAE
jgi:hypothetical protein